MWKVVVLFCLQIVLVIGAKTRYDNYTLYKVLPENEAQIKRLIHLQDTDNKENDNRLDFWNDPTSYSSFVSIVASPKRKADLEEFLNASGIKYNVALENIQSQIENEKVDAVGINRNDQLTMRWDAYYKLDDIYRWLDNLAMAYPSIVTLLDGGISYEGRVIKGIKISHGPGKRAVFLEGGIHSREWISPSSVCYVANEILTSNETEVTDAAQDYDWYIFPVINPDGYVFSHESDRFWRKNRRPFGNDYGVDLNRNWDSNWMVHGASDNPSTEIYAGPSPFSESETRTLSEFIKTVINDIDLYLSIHSYGQLLLIPYGNTTEPLANYYDAMKIGRLAMGGLSVRYGTPYVTGNIAEAIYMATGGSDEWVKDLGVPLVYCYELRDSGQFGFLLPSNQILPNNEEFMDSILEMIHQAKRMGYMLPSSASVNVFNFGMILLPFVYLMV